MCCSPLSLSASALVLTCICQEVCSLWRSQNCSKNIFAPNCSGIKKRVRIAKKFEMIILAL
uniref:Secreted protein n=1 Tax=Octopus bimaculoides TaxID=37653 RepID=A0A0L8GH28_OCTBM